MLLWKKMSKGCTGSLRITSYNCLWMYNYLNIKSSILIKLCVNTFPSPVYILPFSRVSEKKKIAYAQFIIINQKLSIFISSKSSVFFFFFLKKTDHRFTAEPGTKHFALVPSGHYVSAPFMSWCFFFLSDPIQTPLFSHTVPHSPRV